MSKLKSSIEKSKDKNLSDDLSETFKKYIDYFIKSYDKYPENINPEFEVRFGTKKIKNINKVDFYNVIKSLLANEFKLNNENYILKIINDNNLSNIRTEILGLPNIQSYCKLDNLSGILDENNLNFVEKDYFNNNGSKLYPLDFDDFNFRISYQVEKNYTRNNATIQDMQDKWNSTKKIFRYIKRYEYIHPELPLLIHCSIVKTSKTNLGKMMSEFNIKDSNVFNSLENYEIEIELNNALISNNKKFENNELLYGNLKKAIKYILIGLQETNYPISISEQNIILNDYLKLIKNKDYVESYKINVKDFIGPSSSTLHTINLLEYSEVNSKIPNIRNNYTVTDKADGTRKLMYISNNGKIYLISTTMSLQFTGCYTEMKELFNTLIDGEHILHDKNNNYINNYAAFDIYYINGKNVTGFPFINLINNYEDISKKDIEQDTPSEKITKKKSDENDETNNYRLTILNSVIKTIKCYSITKSKELPIKFIIKKFYGNNIFNGCKTILNNVKDGLYIYNTDGLIFTPANTGVCNNKTGFIAPNYKITWNESFKWKPPEYNTIDFLVKFKKNDYGNNFVGNISNDGLNFNTSNQVTNYLTLILNVGFDEKKHGYINPFNSLLNDDIKNKIMIDSNDTYKPARFYPTNPSDNNAGICNILCYNDESNNLKIYTIENEEIEDNTIVEFKYDITKPELWRWIPLRVRYDKTSELRSGIKNYGNAYHVANSNWSSIHNPVTEDMLKSGANIPDNLNDDDVYYNKVTNVSETRCLRDFHNLYIKSLLINRISKIGNTLIDYAVGKGGDLPKWINAKLDFILGIDLSKDNIENRLDGACARYLNYAKKYDIIPKAIFLNGNSNKNIKNGDAFSSEKNIQIIKALFGEGSKNMMTLGKAVYNKYGIAKTGFNISSIQFALHYMFENEIILNEFLTNIAQCTAKDGYFIGTCYDGSNIFNMLKPLNINESTSIIKNDVKIWEITKRYNNIEYNDDNTCLGYAIDVYQETINKTFREYLVNFNYLTRLMENYGFVLLNESELKELNLYNSIGTFEELFNLMNTEIKSNKSLLYKIGNSQNISNEEKQISFLNKYFIFKKIRDIDANNFNKKNDNLQENDNLIIDEMDKLDESVESIQKQQLIDKSKKLAEKYINEQETSIDIDKKEKLKESIDEKIKLAQEKKKAKELEKEKLKEEKKKAKELEKEKLKEEKRKAKELEKEKLKEAKKQAKN